MSPRAQVGPLVVVEAQSQPWPHLCTAQGLTGLRPVQGEPASHQWQSHPSAVPLWWPEGCSIHRVAPAAFASWPVKTMLRPAWPTSPT